MKNKKPKVGSYIIAFIAVAVIYFYTGKLGLSLAYFNDSTSPVWPAAGIALVTIVLLGYRLLPAVLLGAFLINYTTTPSMITAMAISIGNTLEAGIGAFLIYKFAAGKDVFLHTKKTRNFFLIVALTSLISAVIGIFSLLMGGFLPASDLLTAGITWWIGNFLGTLIVFPLIIALYHKAPIKIERKNYLEILMVYIILLFLSTIIFLGWPIEISRTFSIIFICIPVLIWIAFRSCLKFTSIAAFLTSIIAIVGTINKLSIFNTNAINTALLLLQIFIGIITITAVLISVSVVEYKNKIRQLERK